MLIPRADAGGGLKDELKDIWLRLEHADNHMGVLDAQVTDYLSIQEGAVVGEFDADSSEYVFRLTGALPPVELGLVVGDVLHSLRAALDNLIHAVVVRHGGTVKRSNQFPIYNAASSEQRKRTTQQLAGVRANYRAVVEAAQPYHWGAEASKHPLALLRDHSNADKHRVLTAAAVQHQLWLQDLSGNWRPYHSRRDLPAHVTRGFSNLPFPTEVRDGEVVGFSFGASDDRAELMRVQLRNVGPNPRMEVSPGFTVDVVFGHLPRRIGRGQIIQIRDQVRRVVQAVEDQL